MRTKTERLKSLKSNAVGSLPLANRTSILNQSVSASSSKLQLLAKTKLLKLPGKKIDHSPNLEEKKLDIVVNNKGSAIMQHKVFISKENKRKEELLKEVKQLKKPRLAEKGREDTQCLSPWPC